MPSGVVMVRSVSSAGCEADAMSLTVFRIVFSGEKPPGRAIAPARSAVWVFQRSKKMSRKAA